MTIRTPLFLLATVAVLAGFVAFNVLLGATVRGVRADLTAGRIYTLSEGVKPLLQRLPEPVALELFYSEDAGRGIPAVATYAQRVREFLEELVSASGGTLSLRVVDPLPYSEAEDEAVAAGLAALSVDGAGRSLTLGLVATNSVDQRQAIPFLDPSKEPFLEYDILRLIESVGRAKKARLGVLSTLPISGALAAGGDPRRPPAPPWQIDLQLRELFEVVEVQPDDEALPAGLDLLLLIQPRGVSEPLLRAIDAHALRGGRILAFLDPLCDHSQIDPQLAQLGIAGALGSERAFDLGPLPKAWGIEIPADRVVGDRTFALQVQTPARGDGRGPRIVQYLPLLGVDERGLDRDDPITGALELVVMTTVGAIDRASPGGGEPGAADAATAPEIVPLIQSSADSMRIETAMVSTAPDPAQLLAQFTPSGVREPLAVKIGGAIRSAFDDPMNAGEPGATPPAAPARPSAPAAIIVVADADLLADENWIVEERLGSISLGARTVADNGAFVLNALEMLSGDSAMLALRSRGKAARGFERVEEIRKAAEERYLARERELEEQIELAQQRISDLQRARPREGEGPGAAGQLILSPEQERQLEALEQDVLAARRELREVQFNLRAEYERLGTRLMVVNVVAWPLMVALGAMAWFVHRGRRVRRGGAR